MTVWVVLIDTKWEGTRYFDSVHLTKESAEYSANLYNSAHQDEYYVEEIEVQE